MELPVQWKLWITCILQTKYVFHHFPGRFPSYFIPRITLARRQLPLSPFNTWGVQKRTDLQDVIDVQLLLTAGVNGWNFSENRDRLLCSLFAAKKFKWFTFYRLFTALGSIMNIYQWQLEKPKLKFFFCQFISHHSETVGDTKYVKPETTPYQKMRWKQIYGIWNSWDILKKFKIILKNII